MISYFVKIIFARSYKYLLLSFFSLVIGSFFFGSVVSLSQSLSSYFTSEGKTLIGADVVLNSANPIDISNDFFEQFQGRGHEISTQYGVQAVFRNESGTTSVASSIRAVESTFPLYGSLVIEGDVPFQVGERRIYVEKSFLDKIKLNVGDEVLLGNNAFNIAGVLIREPDSVSVGVSFSPKVIMAKSDLLESGIDLSQSRISYKVLIKQNSLNPLTNEEISLLKSYAKENKLRFDDASDGPNNFVRGLSSVSDFIGIVLAIALFLVAVNIGANLAYIITRFKKTIAILKTFGATTTQIRYVFLIILSSVGFVAGLVGSLLGAYLVQRALPLFSVYVSGVIPSAEILPISLIGAVSGLLLIAISSIPFFSSLRSITPKELLANISVTTTKKSYASFLMYIPLPLFLGLILFGISRDITLTLYAVLGLITLFSFFGVISYGIIMYLYKARSNYSFMFSSIVSFLKWRGLETVITSASIMTALSGVFIVSAVEENIVYNIQNTISESAPALYLVDITKSQLSGVSEIAGPTFKEYPIVRGRLLAINNRDLTTSNNGGITREFNMTYRNSLIEGETLYSGVWHGVSGMKNSLSFEKSFAEEVGGVALGDKVTVFIQGLNIEATVTSIHEADKSQGTPFFFMVFSPDVLERFPATYFGTVNVISSEENLIETRLGAEFPNVIPIKTSKILETVNSILNTVIIVVKVIGIPSILLGLMLVLVMTGQSLYERKADVLVLRVFGMKKNSIALLFVAEAGMLIVIATGIAYCIAHIIAYILNVYLFSFTKFSFAMMPIYTSLGILIITAVFSYFIANSLIKTPLKKLLSEN